MMTRYYHSCAHLMFKFAIILFAIIVPNYIVNVNDKLLCTAQLLPDDDPTKGKFLFVYRFIL